MVTGHFSELNGFLYFPSFYVVTDREKDHKTEKQWLRNRKTVTETETKRLRQTKN